MSIPSFSRNRLKYSVNEKFFDKWNSQMAYVLGFSYSDGNIYKTSLAWDIQKRDKDLLIKIKAVMNSTYPIIERPHSVRFRMSNQILIKGALKQGLIEKKSKRMNLPNIPKKFVSHFVRGFLDGDGWIVKRNNRNEVDLGFVSGNKVFLEEVSKLIYKNTGILRKVREKSKVTPKDYRSTTYLLEYYSNKAIKVANWIYGGLSSEDLFLQRKYKKYLEFVKLYEYLNSGNNEIIRNLQKNLGKPIKDILQELYVDKGFNGQEIATILGVHPSSIYRWLAVAKIRY